MSIEGIKRKIAGLKALGQGEGHEARSAMRKAHDLANRHGLNIDEIERCQPGDAPVARRHKPRNSALWRASLGWCVARYAGVEMVRSASRWTVIGRPSDIDLWLALFTRAEMEIETESAAYVAALPDGVSKRSEGDTWRKGAAAGFGQRLQTFHEKSTKRAISEPSDALVLVGRDALVKAKTKALFPHLRSISISAGGSSSAYSRGHRHGRSMGVHRGSIGGS